MSRNTAILVLLFAATLEAGGDAIIRVGLHANTPWHRYALFAAAAVILFTYGWINIHASVMPCSQATWRAVFIGRELE